MFSSIMRSVPLFLVNLLLMVTDFIFLVNYRFIVSMEIVKVGETDAKFESTTTGSVKIEVVNMPTLRYVRRVTFTKLDMIGELRTF